MNKGKIRITRNLGGYFVAIILIVIALGIFFVAKKKNEPIIIGYSGQLTGRQAELGVQERNGVQLAVEKINASGGIAGHKISLIVHDDLGIPKEAESGDDELIKEGAIAIIGHVTSAQTLAGLKVTNPANVIMIGPTVSSPELSGLDDYFFRVHPSFKIRAEAYAEYIYQHKGIKNIAIIYDKDNLAYSKNYSTIFADEFKLLSGNITNEVSFSSVDQPDFFPLLSELNDSKSEALLIVASDIDTALIAQRVKLMNWKISMFASGWAQTETLISNGGQAVEGMEVEQAYALTNQSSNFIDFQNSYKARFGNEPSFGAAYSYESILVLSEALRKTNGNKEGLKEALLETQNFNGLMDTFSLDEFGDVQRPWHLSTIHNGKFILADQLTLTNSGGE